MRDDSLALLHASFATVFNKKTDIAGRFYENLFRDAPEARGLFSDDLTRQKEMFASMLTEIVSCAETPVAFADKVKSLGESHKRYKIPAAHFDIAGKALLGALLALWPVAVLPVLGVWLVFLTGTGFVGLSTICAALSMPLFALVHRPEGLDAPLLFYGVIVAMLVVYAHRSNLVNMRRGTEKRMEGAMFWRRSRKSSL